jgi:outer membrane protein assembly factor BamB
LLILPTLAFGQEFDKTKMDNWHQWRGPLGNGVVVNANPPLNWDEKKNVKWFTKIPGEGSSTPIIWGNQLFVLSAIDTQRPAPNPPAKDPQSLTQPPSTLFEFVVFCLDRNSGDIIWQKVLTELCPHSGRHQTHSYAAASPTTDGQRLFVSFGSYGIYCLTMDGEVVWNRDLGDMRTRRGWGEAISPVLHEDKLIVNWDNEDDSRLYVLNAKSGETLWQTDRDEPTTWFTPLVLTYASRELVILPGTNRVRCYDLDNGKQIWEVTGLTVNSIPSPVYDDNQVVCMSGYQGNAAVSIAINQSLLTESPEVQWRLDRGMPYVPSPVLVDDRLYFTKGNEAVLSCIDAKTGKPLFDSQRLPGLKMLYASPVAAGGRIYFCARDGATLVIRNSAEFEILATNQLSHPIDASPAIIGNQMFLRSSSGVYCLQELN